MAQRPVFLHPSYVEAERSLREQWEAQEAPVRQALFRAGYLPQDVAQRMLPATIARMGAFRELQEARRRAIEERRRRRRLGVLRFLTGLAGFGIETALQREALRTARGLMPTVAAPVGRLAGELVPVPELRLRF